MVFLIYLFACAVAIYWGSVTGRWLDATLLTGLFGFIGYVLDQPKHK